jgi:hypothetical protein
MASAVEQRPGETTCLVDVSPEVVDAGAALTLKARVLCSPPCDLRGHTLALNDQTGAEICSMAIGAFDGTTNETDELVVKAPLDAGPQTWQVVCPSIVEGGVSYAEATTTVSFTVAPHATRVVVWDVPSAVVAGERFRIKLGIKCSSECSLTRREVIVNDHQGLRVATMALPADIWEGTTGLHASDVEIQAPADEGHYTWSVECPDWDVGIPHAAGSSSLGLTVVGHPEHVVRVETVDRDTLSPLGGARVVMHPYRAVADERGVAEMRVRGGVYTLFVSRTGYSTFELPLEVDRDVTARAELGLEPLRERD